MLSARPALKYVSNCYISILGTPSLRSRFGDTHARVTLRNLFELTLDMLILMKDSRLNWTTLLNGQTTFAMARVTAALLLMTAPFATSISERTACIACNPSNVKSIKPPSIGPDMASMYTDLIESVQGKCSLYLYATKSNNIFQGIHWQKKRESILQRDGTGHLCCVFTV